MAYRVVLCSSSLLDSRQQVLEVGDRLLARGSSPSLLRTSESPDSMAPRTAQTLLPHIVQQLIWWTKAYPDTSVDRPGRNGFWEQFVFKIVDICSDKCLSVYPPINLNTKLVNLFTQIYVCYGFWAIGGEGRNANLQYVTVIFIEYRNQTH